MTAVSTAQMSSGKGSRALGAGEKVRRETELVVDLDQELMHRMLLASQDFGWLVGLGLPWPSFSAFRA